MAILNPADLRAAIAQLIGTVPNAGQVHQRRRVIRNENQLKEFFWDVTNSRISGWMIAPSPTNPMTSERHPGYIGNATKGGGNVISTFTFQIEGIFGLNDGASSETVFGDLVWAVADEFNSYGSIARSGGGAVPGLLEQLPCQVEQFGFIVFAGTPLCHYARLAVGFRGRTRG
jgi:hypothetical protein